MASITQTGSASWRVLVRRKGHATVCRTFKTEREARAFAKRAEAEIASGGVVSRGTLTVGDAIRRFCELRDAGPRKVNWKGNEGSMLRHLRDGLGDVEIDKLTPRRLAEWCRTRADDGAGPYTVGMEVSKLGTVLKYAAISMNTVLPDVVGSARPMLTYSGLIGPGKARTRRPTAEELRRVLEFLDPQMQDVVRFAIATAMRRGEIVRITWADVDESRRCVLIRDRKHPTAKAGNHQLIPLIARTGFDAWEILQRQPRVDDRIFPISAERVSDTFGAACAAAKVGDLHFHDLRHHATSLLFESGLAIEQVAIVTGHGDWRNLRRYTHLRPESLHAV